MTCSDCTKPITKQSRTGRCRVCAIHHMNASDPTLKARRASAWRARLQDPDIARQRKEIGKRNARAHLGWCPPRYLPEYQHLRRYKQLGAAEAKRIIQQQIANDTKGLDPLAAAIVSRGLAA